MHYFTQQMPHLCGCCLGCHNVTHQDLGSLPPRINNSLWETLTSETQSYSISTDIKEKRQQILTFEKQKLEDI